MTFLGTGALSLDTPYNRFAHALTRSNGADIRNGQARCPAHEDRNPSLSVTVGQDGRVLLNCHAGCATEAVVAAVGLELADLFPERAADPLAEPDRHYDYVDEHGTVLFQVVRKPGKQFRQRRPAGTDWVWNLKGVRRVLYRLPQVLAAVDAGDTVFVAEGEKDVHALERAGCVATTNPGGAGKWRPEYNDALAGADVVVVADRDEPGMAHARQVAQALAGVAANVRVVQAARGKDAADHLAAGLDVEALELVTLDDPEPAEVQAPEQQPSDIRLRPGGGFVLDVPDGVPAVWGRDDEVLWAEGEPLLLVAPPGVGKTTIAGQVLRARLGLDDTVLGYPVQTGERVLYLACDRPRQIARSLRRIFRPDDRQALDDRLVIWEGPPPTDLAQDTDALLLLCRRAGATTVFIDSAKDVALGLTDDTVGASYNSAVQKAIAAGIEVCTLHHQRKGQNGEKPRKLEDVYGSTWITAGAGSVLLLWGQAGDPVVELNHLKQPATDVGPIRVEHDHDAGRSHVLSEGDPLAILHNRGADGLTANELAMVLTQKNRPTDLDRRKAQRKLDRLVTAGLATVERGSKGGHEGTQPNRYYATEPLPIGPR